MNGNHNATWRTERFGAFVSFRNGLNFSASAVGDGTKLVGVGDFQDNFTIDYAGLQRVRGFDHLSDEDLLQNEDLLFVRSNGNRALIGRVLFIQNLTERVSHSGFTIKARLKSEELDPLFTALFFTSDLARAQIFRHGSGTNISNLSQDILSDVRVPLPPRDEQEAIAAVLMTWERGIRQVSDLIAAKLHFKQGMMQGLLTGQKRIANFPIRGKAQLPSGNSFDESIVALEIEFGITGKSFQEGIPAVSRCPSGWEQHPIGELLTVAERPAGIRDDVTYQLVTAKRYRGGIVPREQLRGDQIKTKTQFFVAAGDFLISKRQIIHGACGVVPAALDSAVVSNEYACLRPGNQLDPGFLEYLAHTRYFQQTCFHASVGVALEKMIFRLDQWLKHPINVPPVEEQRAIAQCLSTMDCEILLLARQRRLLGEQKRGLMQKLLTGQVRVKP
jgi:type I restriction enzyme, S subunit